MMSLTPTKYYYCPDYDKYVKRVNGAFYSIDDNGKEMFDHRRFCPILIGEIFTIDITKEEYEKHLK